jgi:hypothetical protein
VNKPRIVPTLAEKSVEQFEVETETSEVSSSVTFFL